jgi:uncharacterized phiE125 gp8 family phage protein
MWRATKLIEGPEDQPVTVLAAAQQAGLDAADVSRYDELDRQIKAATAYVERYCSIRLVTQSIEMICDAFRDLDNLPDAPLQEIGEITYIDPAGAIQVLAPGLYEARLDDLSPSIALVYDKAWPATRPGSRIRVAATAGYGAADSVPAPIVSAILDLVGLSFSLSGKDVLVRMDTVEGIGSRQYGGVVEVSGAVDRAVADLLANYRRWPL